MPRATASPNLFRAAVSATASSPFVTVDLASAFPSLGYGAGAGAAVATPFSAQFAGRVAAGGDFEAWVAALLMSRSHGRDGSEAGAASARLLASDIARVTRAFCAAQGHDHALVHLRAQFPSRRYRVPRWHADGKYWAGEHALKLVVAIRGAGTMFGRLKPGRVYPDLPLAPGVRGRFARARAALDAVATEHRNALAGAVDPVRRLATLEAGVYRVGASGQGGAPGEEGAALHSEPDIDHRRLFLAVLPGTAAQVRSRRDRAGTRRADKRRTEP
jgi:hypothetical protein